MKKEEIEPKLASVFSSVEVVEGLICAKTSGEVITGQTLTEMDHAGIAKSIASIIKVDFNAIDKGKIVDFTIGLENGFVLTIVKDDEMIIGLLGKDGKGSVGLLNRQLKNIINS
jgi:predicted regulator of Ras-like GTPase activity (Roadblock/LC7/MglB family)